MPNSPRINAIYKDLENDDFSVIGSKVEYEDALRASYRVDFHGPKHHERAKAYLMLVVSLDSVMFVDCKQHEVEAIA